ncbi:hypothetical protein HPB48_021371 [Haemaphysalis longicornis]|uniref:Uncharacterized protein n=1 Tax=Haemaphysalis longicornis TaxID=44386 RepID=A0A9J6GVQ3_HAELO|nr:hypothetical protein HPB48_021371 [Haemaphysalis longicornis]
MLLPLVADLDIVRKPVLSAVILLVLGVLFAATPHTTSAAHVGVIVASSVTVGTCVAMKQEHKAECIEPEAVSLVAGSSALILLPLLLCNPMIVDKSD